MGNLESTHKDYYDWFHQLIFGKHSTKLKVIMWGLPSSGKTSILKALTSIKHPETITFKYQDDLAPTKKFNMQDFYHTTDHTYRIIMYDVGGASGSNLISIFYFIAFILVESFLGSDLVKKFCGDLNAVVYVVDSSIKNKIMYPVVHAQLTNLCKLVPPSMPIVLVLSKNDVAHLAPTGDILEGIQFEDIKKHFPSKVFQVISTSSVDQVGLVDMLSWLADNANLS